MEANESQNGISSYTAGVLSKHVVRLDQTESRIPYDLITFLSAAQWRSIDFVPITWHPALDNSRGFTARVHQSLVTTSFTFGFKRYRFPEQEDGVSNAYKALISELCILGHPVIRQHNHILRLEGACWDPSTTPDDIFPVLVFERTRHGNLAEFMQSNHGRSLSMHDRLVLCTHLIQAIETLHSCNIIHGDIKPENILVFEGEDGKYISKVCDFGFSTMCDGDSIIQLPSTQPWTAPEYHKFGFDITGAKKMDCYSLGLVCLWLLLDRYQTTVDLRNNHTLQPTLVPNPCEENRESRYKWIETVKLDAFRRAAILTGISDATSLNQGEKSGLFQFFRMTLDENSESRIHDLTPIKNILCAETPPIDGIMAISNLSFIEGFDQFFCDKYFDLSKSIQSLMNANYRVRVKIFNTLKFHAENYSSISPQANFLLALCSQIGFGNRRSEVDAQIYLDASGKTPLDLTKLIGEIKNSRTWSYENPKVTALSADGLIRSVDHLDDYRYWGNFSEVEQHYSEEVSDMEQNFDATHPVIMILQGRRVEVLRDQSKLLQAKLLLESQIASFETLESVDRREVLFLHSQLALILKDMGDFKRSQSVMEGVLAERVEMFGINHQTTLITATILASILSKAGLYAQAQEIYERVRTSMEDSLGSDNPETSSVLSNLAEVHWKRGQYDLAEQMARDAVTRKCKVLGDDHQDTLTSWTNLAGILLDRGKSFEAEDIFQHTIATKEKYYGAKHKSTLNSIGNLACLYLRQGRYYNAEVLIQRALLGLQNLHTREHQAVQTTLNNLAHIYSSRGQYERAEMLCRESYDVSSLRLGPGHLDTIVAGNGVALNLQRQGKNAEAESLYCQLLEIAEEQVGDLHPSVLAIQSNLASLYSDQLRLQEAEAKYLDIIKKSVLVHGEEYPTTMKFQSNLASVLQDLGKYEEAEEMNRSLLEKRRQLLGNDHPHTLTTMINLSSTLQARGEYLQAEELASSSTRMSSEKFGKNHPITKESAFLLMIVRNAVPRKKWTNL